MRIAVIDLGTNTCNLLVAEFHMQKFRILHQSKALVRLGDDKIKENEISEGAIQRTCDAFKAHQTIIKDFQPDYVKVLATSAVRSANNKVKFLEQLSEQCGWIVKVISGEREADLIFKGVLLAFTEFEEPSVILDIGGGSNELIMVEGKEFFWKESQPTGMSRILNRFELSDPTQEKEIQELQAFFKDQHKDVIRNCKKYKVKTLVGCSGAFDTIADMIDEVEPGKKQRMKQTISIDDFYKVYKRILSANHKERLKMIGMDYVRVDLIVPAVILIESLVSELSIKEIIQTDFALREGVLFEKMHAELTNELKS